MQRKKLLHTFFQESGVLHKKIHKSLSLACEGLLKSKKLSVAGIARSIPSKTTYKHNIKRIDRLLSSPTLAARRELIYQDLAHKVVPKSGYCPIVVDTSCLTADSRFQVIRAGLTLSGRTYTLYEMVYENGQLSNTYEVFIERLSRILPSEKGRVIVITDAGFYNKWFHLIQRKNWDFIGRVRQDKSYTTLNSITAKCRALHASATSKPTCHGKVYLSNRSRHDGIECHLYSVKKKSKNRKLKTKTGRIKQSKYSKLHAIGQKEPWILVSSLSEGEYTAEQVVKFYSYRMQIEESFRAIKNAKNGFCFKHTMTRNVTRLNALLLIAAITTFVMWSVGLLAEECGWQKQCQSNTSKKRSLSLFFLGAMILDSSYF
jgi:hypothetical protein